MKSDEPIEALQALLVWDVPRLRHTKARGSQHFIDVIELGQPNLAQEGPLTSIELAASGLMKELRGDSQGALKITQGFWFVDLGQDYWESASSHG